MEPVCFPASHKALTHMKLRGSLAATVLSEGKKLLEAAPTLTFHIRRMGEAFCLLGGEVIFQ